jgi:beta-lactamase regulating signal transducer with metallopeptidase domain/tetratricopeptide (TPR) repeat protein
MNEIIESVKTALGDPVVSRLFFVSLEIIIMAALAGFIVRVMRIKSMRFVALVWLLVLAKPILGLFMGSPLHLVNFRKPDASMIMNISPDGKTNLDDLIATQMEKDQKLLSDRSSPMVMTGSTEKSFNDGQNSPETGKSAHFLSIPLGTILRIAWLAGIFSFLCLTIFDQLRIMHLRKSALPPSQEMGNLYQNLVKGLGIGRSPKLGLSSVLESPALVGIVNPMILFPQWLNEKYDRSQIEWLMRHELMHWMHKDSFGLVLRRVSEILFFFHPAIWWAGRKWEEAMELACDRALLKSEPEAKCYAGHLFRLLENQQTRLKCPVSAGLFATRTQIGKRIAALLSNPLRNPVHLGALSVSALFILAILGFTLGLGFQKESGAQEETKSNAQMLEEGKIREKASKVHADLRTLCVAMEAYNVDNNIYPFKFHALTTPIAYMTQIPPDPFAVSDTQSPGSELQFLKMNYAPDYKSIYLYSVGPDGADQEGSATYDPTNGTISAGDIIRIVDVRDRTILSLTDRDLQEKVDAQKNALLMVKSALESWFLANRSFPDSLKGLLSPTKYIGKIPEDLFAPVKPVSYIYDKEGRIALVYSIGPDKVDDNGIVEISGFHEKGEIPKGDIVIKLDMAELEERHPQNISSEALDNDIMMQELLKIKKQDGKDNALIHYQMASKMMPPTPNEAQQDLIKRILNQGWDASAGELIPYINSYKPMFAEIRKGIALDYAKNVGWEKGPATPVPNFLTAQISSKMLCVEGRYLESQGKYREALDNYLTALTMGRDYGAPDGALIAALISIAVEKISLRQIHHIAASGNLKDTDLEALLDRLKEIEETTVTPAGAMSQEAHCMKWIFKKMRENPEELNRTIADLEKEFGAKREMFAQLADLWEAEHDKLWDFQLNYIRTPYWERNSGEFEKKLNEMLATASPLIKISFPNFNEADVRITITFSSNRETRITVALELFKSGNGHFPASLSELVPKYFDNLPVDPFSGKIFMYNLSEKGDSYTLYSLGPDITDNDAKTLYDPTNGTISSGDLKF